MEEILLSKLSVDPEKEIFKDPNQSMVSPNEVRDHDSFDGKSVNKKDIISSVDLDEMIEEDESEFRCSMCSKWVVSKLDPGCNSTQEMCSQDWNDYLIHVKDICQQKDSSDDDQSENNNKLVDELTCSKVNI